MVDFQCSSSQNDGSQKKKENKLTLIQQIEINMNLDGTETNNIFK